MSAMQWKYRAYCCAEPLFAEGFHFQQAIHCADEKLRQGVTCLFAREAHLQGQTRILTVERLFQDRQGCSHRGYMSARRGGDGGGGRVLPIYDFGFMILDLQLTICSRLRSRIRLMFSVVIINERVGFFSPRKIAPPARTLAINSLKSLPFMDYATPSSRPSRLNCFQFFIQFICGKVDKSNSAGLKKFNEFQAGYTKQFPRLAR